MCPEHLTNQLVLHNNLELHCTKCVTDEERGNGETVKGVYKVLDFTPVKIDFINDFTSELVPHSTQKNTDNWTNWRRENLNFLLDRNINKDSLGLDIGSGNQPFKTFLNLPRIITIDFTRYPGVNIISDLNNNIPLVSESMDYIIMTNLLEHLYDLRVLKEARRLLKENGSLYITVPFLLDVHQAPYDYHRYTYLYLQKKLNEEGFEIEYLKPSGDFGTFQTLVEHYYRYPIHRGYLVAKILWQVQKIINYLLKKFLPNNFRNDFTGGYMLCLRKLIN